MLNYKYTVNSTPRPPFLELKCLRDPTRYMREPFLTCFFDFALDFDFLDCDREFLRLEGFLGFKSFIFCHRCIPLIAAFDLYQLPSLPLLMEPGHWFAGYGGEGRFEYFFVYCFVQLMFKVYTNSFWMYKRPMGIKLLCLHLYGHSHLVGNWY